MPRNTSSGSAGTRSRSSSASATRRPRARPLRRLGEATWAAAARLPLRAGRRTGRWARPTTTRRPAPRSSATAGRPVARPRRRRPRVRGRARRVRDAGSRRPAERLAPALVRLLHAAAAADVDRGRAARPVRPTRASTSGTPARSARSSRRRSCAGCATSSATAPDSFGLLTSGGVMANFMAMALARDVHLPSSAGSTAPPRGARPRGRPRLRLGPDALLDRAGARRARASRPTRSSSSPADERLPAARRRPSRRRSPRDRAAGLTPLAIAAVAGLHEHGLGRRASTSSPTSPSAKACGSTSTRPTAGRPGSPASWRPRPRPASRPTR